MQWQGLYCLPLAPLIALLCTQMCPNWTVNYKSSEICDYLQKILANNTEILKILRQMLISLNTSLKRLKQQLDGGQFFKETGLLSRKLVMGVHEKFK